MEAQQVSQLFLQLGVAAVFAFAWLKERDYSQKLTERLLDLIADKAKQQNSKQE